MKTNISRFLTISLSAIMLIGSMQVISLASHSDGEKREHPTQEQWEEHKEERKEKHEAVEAAIEAGDYNAFAEAVGDSKFAEKINAGNFDQLIEAHELKEAGDKEGAKAIMEELGIKSPHHRGGGEYKEERKAFIESLTDDQKDILDQARELKEAGQEELAKELLDAAGIELPQKKGHKNFKNFKNSEFFQGLSDEQKETLKEAHELAKGGDHEAAEELLEEAGIERPERHEHPDHIKDERRSERRGERRPEPVQS